MMEPFGFMIESLGLRNHYSSCNKKTGNDLSPSPVFFYVIFYLFHSNTEAAHFRTPLAISSGGRIWATIWDPKPERRSLRPE